MKIITVGTAMQAVREYEVYENEEEFKATGLTASTVLHETEIGQYYRFDNGIYAPLLKRNLYEQKIGSTLYEYYFPQFRYMQRGTKYRIGLNYFVGKDVDFKRGVPRYGAADMYFVKLLNMNVDIDIAYATAYKRRDYRARYKILERVFSNPRFTELLNKENIMSRMKAQLEQAGLTENYLAGKFKEILEDPKAPASLKQYTLEKVGGLLKITEEQETPVVRNASVADGLRLVSQTG